MKRFHLGGSRSAVSLERRRFRLASCLATLAILAAACSTTSASPAKSSGSTTHTTGAAGPANKLLAIHHVFVIMLENEGYSATFGAPATDPYLAQTLPSKGAMLENYYSTGHFSNDNYISFVSGQAPNPSNQADCQVFAPFPPTSTVTSDGQISGSGCVYPSSVRTIANQLTESGKTWKGYMQDMGNVPSRESAVCGHPTIGTADGTQRAVVGDGYATRHDPFAYFQSIIGNTKLCDSRLVPLGTTTGALPTSAPSGTTGLVKDLTSIATTPNFSFISPNLCNDGHDAPCVNQPGASTPLPNVDAFLRQWVPIITGSPAYKKDGLLEITFDEAGGGDAASCCNEVAGPAAAAPGINGPGGGRIGTVLLSPFIKAGTVSTVPYNHYSSLATIETIFGLPKLGEAKLVTATFGKDIFGR